MLLFIDANGERCCFPADATGQWTWPFFKETALFLNEVDIPWRHVH